MPFDTPKVTFSQRWPSDRRTTRLLELLWAAKHRKSCEKLPWELLGCQGVMVFLLKDVIITTSVTAVIFITITIWVFELSQFYFCFAQFEFFGLVTIWSFKLSQFLFYFFFFLFYHSLSSWVLLQFRFFFSFVTFNFVVRRGKLRSFTLQNPPEVFWKFTPSGGYKECAVACFA